MPPRNSLFARLTLKLTALVMAHGLSSTGHAQTTNAPGPATTPPGATNTPPITVAPDASATNAPTKLQDVIVTGQQDTYKSQAISLPKFDEPLRDTPQSITVVPRQVMNDQASTTLRDALRNVAGISLAAGEGGSQGDNLTLRGFSARNDIFLDGMRDYGSYYRDPFNLESVDVLQGPESVMFGRGSTGGIVNQESKTPELHPFTAGTLSFGTDLTRRATADINQPLPDLGKGAAFRLNLMGNASQVAGRDVGENNRYGFAPSLALGLGTPTRATFSYLHQAEDDIPDYGIPWLLNGPAPVERHNFYGFRDDYLRTDVDIATAKLEHDVAENFTLRDQVRYANYTRDFRISEPRITNPTNAPTPADMIVSRNELTGRSTETFLQNQFDVKGSFDVAFIHNTAIGGVEAGRETSSPKRFGYSGVPTTSLLSPDDNQAFTATSATVNSDVHTRATSVGLYVLDSLELGRHWELSGGFRWDRFDADYSNSVTNAANPAPQSFHRVDYLPSWRGSVAFKPVPIGTLYFTYGTSFNPSAESLSLSAGTANLPPEENRTFEFGTKWDVLDQKLSLHAAAFRTEKTNARETSPTDSTLVVLAGKQRVDGFELAASGRLTADWQVFASYAFLDSEVVSSTFFPDAVGARLANVPKHTFSLWTTYDLPWHLQIGGGGRYVSSRTASSTVPLDPTTGLVKELPGYWTLDAMIKYTVTKNIAVQLNVYNLTDKYYFDQLHPGHIVPGPGRSAMLTTSFRF